jgi:hypothetical protein
LSKGRCTAKHDDHQQRTIHLNGLPLRLSEHPGLAGCLN